MRRDYFEFAGAASEQFLKAKSYKPLMQINDLMDLMTMFILNFLTIRERYCVMASKDTSASSAAKTGSVPFLNWGQERTESATALQKAILESYEQASREWLARVQSEVALWSDLAAKLSATRTVPEALETCAKCASQRMQMAADDGRRLVTESQQITQKIAQSLGNGWTSTGST